MTLAINFINTERNEAIESFIKSLVTKTFSDTTSINDIIVNLQTQNDPRVPWKCTIHIFGIHKNVKAEASASNYLTAFSQALKRAERQYLRSSLGISG
ncbi:MAG: hypothetical protein HKO66_14415 [Saprospiraceae bacterium]|nr:HPF/RaiA family ribosome-associated protein [Bacteroidia bacterium]NNE15383.1 hypothetical protein [Saprospiraceae bacterium]NNL93432.1 hypothetical protein [Saprospiraceae bacterium]